MLRWERFNFKFLHYVRNYLEPTLRSSDVTKYLLLLVAELLNEDIKSNDNLNQMINLSVSM